MNFSNMYSHGLDMLLDEIMGTRFECTSDGRNASSGLKRKRGGQPIENVDIFCNAIEYDNEPLNCIAD